MTARDFKDSLNKAKHDASKDRDKDKAATKLQQHVSQLRMLALDSISKNGDTISRHLAQEIINSLKS